MWRFITRQVEIAVTILVVLGTCLFAARGQAGAPADTTGAGSNIVERLTLEQCIDRALEQNHQRPASSFAVAAAEAQHRQALAGYWPQLSFKGGYRLMDESPNFIFPASGMYIPAQTIGTEVHKQIQETK